MKPLRMLVLSAVLLIATACSETGPDELSQPEPQMSTQASQETPQPEPPTNTREAPDSPPPGAPQDTVPEQTPEGTAVAAPQELIEIAKVDLAQSLNIEADQISVVEAASVVWRDAGLGCPKPNIDYIRVDTPGYRIVLEAGGQTYTYHTDEGSRVIQCNQ